MKSTIPMNAAPAIATAPGASTARRPRASTTLTLEDGRDALSPRGRTTTPATSIARERPVTTRNGASKETAPPTIPPSAGPAIAPKLLAARAKPIASPFLPGRARSETRARAATQLAVDPSPCTARPASSTPSDPESAITIEPAPVSTSPPSSRGRRPIRSARRPVGIETTRIGIAYAAIANPSAASPAPVRRSISGRSGAITPSSAVSSAIAEIATVRIARRELPEVAKVGTGSR